MKNKIYLSSGWLDDRLDSEEELEQFLHLYSDIVDGFEIAASSTERIQKYISVSHPDDSGYTVHSSTSYPVSTIEPVLQKYNPSSVVYHPTPEFHSNLVQDFYQERQEIPTVENLDSKFTRERGEELLAEKFESSLGFTLDIQHIFEHDNSMEYGYELLSEYGLSLTEIHLSGYNESTHHALVHKSKNKEQISGFLQSITTEYLSIPIVLEGEYTTIDDIEREVKYVRSILDNEDP